MQELASYDFRIFLCPVRQQIKTDCLGRHAKYRQEEKEDRKPETILEPQNFEPEQPGKPEYQNIHLISGTYICSILPIQ